MLSQKISFGLIVPDVTSRITCAHAHLKPVTRAKQFSDLEILKMHSKYAFGNFGIISEPRTLVC